MSEPKTLTMQGFKFGGELVEESKWVSAEDYAALQAEVERLKEACENNLGRIDALFIRLRELQAENERLRKAGDAMDEYIKKLEERITVIAAKEGGDAK